MKSLLSGSAALTTALLLGSFAFYARPLVAEPNAASHQTLNRQEQDIPFAATITKASLASNALHVDATVDATAKVSKTIHKTTAPKATREMMPLAVSASNATPRAAAAQNYVATAYCLQGRTASGLVVGKGMIATDRTVLPLGSSVRIEAGSYTGVYLVTDTGGGVRGRRIDVWVPTTSEARRFGRRSVRLTVLSYGGKRASSARNSRGS
ncbi:MAG: 3D domain-containing protein [Pyrinomonadaceae bacterium]